MGRDFKHFMSIRSFNTYVYATMQFLLVNNCKRTAGFVKVKQFSFLSSPTGRETLHLVLICPFIMHQITLLICAFDDTETD